MSLYSQETDFCEQLVKAVLLSPSGTLDIGDDMCE